MKKFFTNKNLQKRLLFTLFIFFIYRFGCVLTIPGINTMAVTAGMEDISWLQLISMMGGAGLDQFSIFALGVTPYITSSIIIQLLSMDVIPHLTELAKDGGNGKKKLEAYTRYLAVIFSAVQSVALIYTLNNSSSDLFIGGMTTQKIVFCTVVLTAGTMVLAWLADRITAKGVGNGMSMIIMAGIVGRMPRQIQTAWTTLATGTTEGYWKFAGYIAVMILIIVVVTLLNTAERKIPVQYTSSSVELSQTNNSANYLPFKVNSASVIPVIFASSLMMAPVQIMSFFPEQDWFTTVKNILGMQTWYSLCLYALLIWAFTFFYVKMQVNPEKLAEDLQKSGAYIINVRPGKETEVYINKILSRITVLGALGLTAISILPHLMPLIWTEMPSSMALGGTGLIIVVGVAIETIKQIKGILTQNSYKKYYDIAGVTASEA